jgi:hypothetical protein
MRLGKRAYVLTLISHFGLHTAQTIQEHRNKVTRQDTTQKKATGPICNSEKHNQTVL